MPGWKEIYSELKKYVVEHPDVRVQENLIDIPRAKQPAFYTIFDRVREAYIVEEFSPLLNVAESLSTAYLDIVAEVTKNLDLNDILMPNDVERFLHRPLNQLRREIFDPLFDLLGGTIDEQRFVLETAADVNSSFRRLYQEGYEKWAVFSLLQLFAPDKLFYVPLRIPGNKEIIKHSALARETLPLPIETKRFAFEVGHRQPLLAPDAIIHSTLLDKYVAFRTKFNSAMWKADSYSEKREWYEIESLVEEYGLITLKPDLLIYIADQVEDISLVADGEKICRPDLVIDFIKDDMNADQSLIWERLANINASYTILDPVMGSFVVLGGGTPSDMREQLAKEVDLLEVGLDKSKLEPLLARSRCR